MKLLSKAAILKATDMTFVDVDVPEWGGVVRVQSMSGTSRDAFESSLTSGSGKADMGNIRAMYVASCICDEKGELLFTSADVIELGKKSAKALDRVFTEAQKINMASDDDVEELAKN